MTRDEAMGVVGGGETAPETAREYFAIARFVDEPCERDLLASNVCRALACDVEVNIFGLPVNAETPLEHIRRLLRCPRCPLRSLTDDGVVYVDTICIEDRPKLSEIDRAILGEQRVRGGLAGNGRTAAGFVIRASEDAPKQLVEEHGGFIVGVHTVTGGSYEPEPGTTIYASTDGGPMVALPAPDDPNNPRRARDALRALVLDTAERAQRLDLPAATKRELAPLFDRLASLVSLETVRPILARDSVMRLAGALRYVELGGEGCALVSLRRAIGEIEKRIEPLFWVVGE
jgi:hypothetical protein